MVDLEEDLKRTDGWACALQKRSFTVFTGLHQQFSMDCRFAMMNTSKKSYLFLTLLGLGALCASEQQPPLQVDVTKRVECDERREGAAEGDSVSVHYGGFLKDGTKFDSSFDRQKAFTFELGVGQVIPGWDQGLQGVCVGEERHLVVPAELAYGNKGAGDVIPPGATLLFDIVVVDVNKKRNGVRREEEQRQREQEEQRRRQQEEEEQRRLRQQQEEEEQRRLLQQQEEEERRLRLQEEREEQQRLEAGRRRPASQSNLRRRRPSRPSPPRLVEGCPFGELETRVTSKPASCNRKARAGDLLTMHYTGTLSSGVKFDSSLDRDTPFEFTLGVGQVIEGWDEGVKEMCVGEQRSLRVPPQMAYGAAGVGDVIPGCATLLFDVQLLDIN